MSRPFIHFGTFFTLRGLKAISLKFDSTIPKIKAIKLQLPLYTQMKTDKICNQKEYMG